MPGSDFDALSTTLGLPEDSGDDALVEAFDRALKQAKEKLDTAEGRIHKLRAEKAYQELVEFEEPINQLRVQVGVGPLLDRIRLALEREQFPSAQVFLKKCLELRDHLKDENLVLEIDALQAEIEEGLRRQPIVVPTLEKVWPGMESWKSYFLAVGRKMEVLSGYSERAEFLSLLQSLKTALDNESWVEATDTAERVHSFLEGKGQPSDTEIPHAVQFPELNITVATMRIWNAYIEAVLEPLQKVEVVLEPAFLQHQQELVGLILKMQEPLKAGDWEHARERAEAIQHWMEDYPLGGWEPLPKIPEPISLHELTSMSSDWLNWSNYYREICQKISESESLAAREQGISHLNRLASVIRSQDPEEMERFLEELIQAFPPDEGWPDFPAIPYPESEAQPSAKFDNEEEAADLSEDPPPLRGSEVNDTSLEGETEVYPAFPSSEKIIPREAFTLELGGRRIHVLSKTRTQFGRDGKNVDVLLRVDHPESDESKLVAANRRLSRKHFFIEPIPGAVALVDGTLDDSNQRKPSAAGTFLEGEAVDVDRLNPGGVSLVTVGQKTASPEVPHWEVQVLETGTQPGYPPALFPALGQWQDLSESGKKQDRAAGLWMRRQDLIAEDILLLWTCTPLGMIDSTLDSLWLLRYEDGFCLFDAENIRFYLLEDLVSGDLPGGVLPKVITPDGLQFQDPTERLNR